MDTDDRIDIDGQTDGVYAGQVQGPNGSTIPVHLDDELVEQARAEGADLDRIRDAAVPASATVDLRAQSNGDTQSTIPVQDHRRTDLTSRREADRDFTFIQDDQIRRLIRNSVNYTERVGRFLLERDDLIPTIKERLKALITGEDGLDVEPADPDDDADQRLADHLADIHDGDVRPTDVIDRILRENLMNARAVLRATDLKELDLNELDYLRDGISGEEIYVQDRTTVYEFDVNDDEDGDAIAGIDLERRTVDAQPLVIGEHVFDISLYDEPPLEAVVDTAVNKMVLQRLKARKAEITAYGAVYATVEPPEYLPEDQYFDRVSDDDWDGDGQPPTKLERALENNIQNAFDTLKDFQSGTVMSVPSFWNLEQLEIPETDDPIDDQIRGYNRDISRRLLVPLDLIELQSGSELSRETMFATLMTTIAGWRREIIRIFEAFAEAEADIQGINGDVQYQFPPLKDANTEQIVSALQYAGIAGLSEEEVRQMMNTVQGVDLDTDRDTADMPPEGGPQDGDQRQEQMRQFIDDQRRGDDQEPGPDGSGGPQTPPQPAQAADGRLRFGNVGGDPFGDEEMLDVFVEALYDVGADQVWIGDEPYGDHSGIHDRPITVSGLDADDAEVVWKVFENDAKGLMGPKTAEAADAGAADVLRRVPVLRGPSDGDTRITEDDLKTWLAWVRSGRPSVEAEWNPARHPRGPDGKFVERGWDVPDAVVDDIQDMDSATVMDRLVREGELDEGELNTLLQDDSVRIDGIDDDIQTRSDIQDAAGDGDMADDTPTDTGTDTDGDLTVPDDVSVDDPEAVRNVYRNGWDQTTDDGGLADEDISFEDFARRTAEKEQEFGGLADSSAAAGMVLQELRDDSGNGDSAVDQMADAGWVTDDDAPDLRVDAAESVDPIVESGEGSSTSSAAQNMEVAEFGDHTAFVKRFRSDPDGDRSDGEKPTLVEREQAADAFLRNLGFDDQLPTQFYHEDEQYMSSLKVDGDNLRGEQPAGADSVDEDLFKMFAAATILAGNSDLHGDNWRVQDDGSFAAIDLNKSGGDFTSGGKFRNRGVSMIENVSQSLGIDFDRDAIQERAEGLAQSIDPDEVLDGVENSDISDADRHQFRDNIRQNIEAFQNGDINL